MGRSEFITHWTGRDIELDATRLTLRTREAYVSRLKDILVDGMWMTTPHEELVSTAGVFPVALTQQHPMTCFTELRLSGSRVHFESYGLLGVVVHRNFALQRNGGPVMYVRQHDDDPLVSNVAQILHWLEARRLSGVEGAVEMMHAGFLLCGFMKAMSTPNSDDFAFLDEHEWRILHTDRQVTEKRIIVTGSDCPGYRIPVSSAEVRMLVVPDVEVRTMVLAATFFNQWSAAKSVPILTTDEAENL